ncbi:hypothetical protein ANRL1_02874 [Anaerolineae bacterium]|nr:hypothetical protein ANRL1_02874 [Anaerolineae bacterium]
MPRHMSFSMTTSQVRSKTKDVTRRLGWDDLKPGELFWAIEKGQGLKRGEHVVKIWLCRCVSNTPEPLNTITPDDCVREGFPGYTLQQFVQMFTRHNKCKPDRVVNRIEFEYV